MTSSSSSSARVFSLVDVGVHPDTLQVQITFNKTNKAEWMAAPLKKAFTVAIIGAQREGKSFLFGAISGVPFEVGTSSSLKRTTEGINAALVERNQRVEVLLDSEGWNSAQTKQDFKEKVQKLRPGMNAQELDAVALRQAAELEAKFGELLYRTCDVIIVYASAKNDSAMTFLKNMSKSPTVFKPHIMIVTRDLEDEELLDVFKIEKMKSLEDVKTNFRKIEMFYIPHAKWEQEQFERVVRQIQNSIAHSRALRASTVSSVLEDICNAMKDISNNQQSLAPTPKWIEMLSHVRLQGDNLPKETKNLLEKLHECYKYSLGLITEFDDLIESLGKMQADLAQAADKIDGGVKKNKIAQVALSGASTVASVGGATTTGAAIIVGSSGAAAAVAAAPVAIPILVAATVVATVVGVGLGAGAIASHAVTEAKRSKQREAAASQLKEQQQKIQELAQKTKEYKVKEAELSNVDDGTLKSLYFSFKARAPHMKDEDIARKIMDAYTEVSTTQFVLRDLNSKEHKLDLETTSHETMEKIALTSITQLYKIGAPTAARTMALTAARTVAVSGGAVGAKLATAATKAIPFMGALAVAIDGASLAYNTYHLAKKGTNEDAEKLRSHIPLVQEQISRLTELRNAYMAIKKESIELTEDYLKVKLLIETATKLYDYFAKEEAEASKVAAMGREFRDLYKRAKGLKLEKMQEIAATILGLPAPSITTTTTATLIDEHFK